MTNNRLRESEKKVNGLLKQLREKSKELDSEGKKFYSYLDTQIERIFAELTQHENELKTEAEAMRNSLETNYLKAGETASKIFSIVSDGFSKFLLLVAIFIGLIFFNFAWPIIVYLFPSVLNTLPLDPVFLLPILSLSLGVILLFAFLEFRKRLHHGAGAKAYEFQNLNEQLHKIDLLKTRSYPFESEKSSGRERLDQFVTSFTGAVHHFAGSAPLLSNVYKENKFFASWENVCDGVLNALSFFELDVSPEIQRIKLNPPTQARDLDSDETRTKLAIRVLANEIKIDEKIIALLYDFYKFKNTHNIWEDIKGNNKQLAVITNILYASKHIDIDKRYMPVIGLSEVLKRTKYFNLVEITRELDLCQRICDYFRNYENRLAGENVNIVKKMGMLDLIKSIDFTNRFEVNFLNLFSEELSRNIQVEKKSKSAYVKALMAILFNKDVNFKVQVCQAAATDEVVYVLMAYHDLMQQMQEEKKLFTLSDLLEDSANLDERVKKVNEDSELRRRFSFFKTELGNGNWYDSGTFLLKRMFEDLRDTMSEKIDDARKYKIVQSFIDRNFANININTVDKAVDADLFSVYLILSSSKGGKLIRNVVDVLSGRKEDGAPKRISELETMEKRYGLSLTVPGKKGSKKPKYDFILYSTATRVGVLDRNVSFLDFKEEIMQDISSVIRKQGGDWKNIGLSILRITPSKYSFGLLDKTSLGETSITSKNMHLAEQIAMLATGHVADSEKAVVSQFDKNFDLLLPIINQKNVFEIINSENISLSQANRRILSSDALKEKLFTELSDFDLKNFKELAIAIGKSSVEKRELVTTFERALSSKYNIGGKNLELSKPAASRFSNELFSALEAVSTLWSR